MQNNSQISQDTNNPTGLVSGANQPYINQHQLQLLLQHQQTSTFSPTNSQLPQPLVITTSAAPPPPPHPPPTHPHPQYQQQQHVVQLSPQAGLTFTPSNQNLQYTDQYNQSQLLLPALPVNLQPRQQQQLIQVSNQSAPSMMVATAPHQQPMQLQQPQQQYMQVTQGNHTMLIPVVSQLQQQQQQQGQAMYAILPGSNTPQLVMVETVASQQQEPQFLYDASGMAVQLPSAQLSQQQYRTTQLSQQQYTAVVNEPGMDTSALLR
jgi:hypothetical protein